MDEAMGLFCVDIFVTFEIFKFVDRRSCAKVRHVQRGRVCSDLLSSGARHENIYDFACNIGDFPDINCAKVRLVQRGRVCSDLYISGARHGRIGFGL